MRLNILFTLIQSEKLEAEIGPGVLLMHGHVYNLHSFTFASQIPGLKVRILSVAHKAGKTHPSRSNHSGVNVKFC